MKKGIILIFSLLCSLMVAQAQVAMNNQEVFTYLKEGAGAGKSQQQLTQELMSMGATRTQIDRAQLQYESVYGKKIDERAEQVATKRVESPAMEEAQNVDTSLGDLVSPESSVILPDAKDRVFGRDIFRQANMNFAPSENLATPKNYQLGVGDEVIVEIFGANQATIRDVISPEGSINVDVLGPIYLNGMTIDEANSYLKKRLSQIYAGLNRGTGSSDIRLSLGQIRSIQINVLGDVVRPGTYNVSAFATVFHALYLAGGVKEPGTLRNIKVTRRGRVAAVVDIYEFLMNGSRANDVRLEEGDVILVPPYSKMVSISGMVKRPMLFEMKDGENLLQLITYAGGFAKGAYTETATVVRQTGREYEVRNVDNAQFTSFHMKDGDEVEIGKLLSRFGNRLTIKGAVYREGLYQLSGKVNSVRSLVEAAGGLLPEAFINRAILHREKADRSLEVLSIDLSGIMKGQSPDVVLQNNDVLFVSSVYELKDQGIVTISGEVSAPGTFAYADNMTVEDLVILAGGLLDGASLSRIDVSRRVRDNKQITASKETAQFFSLTMKDGFVVQGQAGFVLEPYDEVFVRKSPSYNKQDNVTVTGQVNFPGTYPLTERGERISSILQKAGGVNGYAYVKGAKLSRVISETERASMDKVVESLSNDITDTLTIKRLKEYGDRYYVGIDLEDALAHPGGSNDVILREGDRIEVPVYSNTVRVMGAVVSPNVVTFRDKKKYKYYVNEAGGYSDTARKHHAYIVYMNGHVSQLKRNTKVLPGSEIVVPKRSHPKASFLETIRSFTNLATLASTLATTAVLITK